MQGRQHKVLFLGVLALVTALGLASCTSGRPANQAERVALPSDFEIIVYQGQAALGGDTVKLSTVLAQGKPVVLNFWAGLCPPCRVEMPDLEAVHIERKGQVVFLGLDIGPFVNLGSREMGKALLRELGVTYPTGTTNSANVVQDYKIIGMPTTLFIKPNGEIVDSWTGLLTKEKLDELTNKLIAASARPA